MSYVYQLLTLDPFSYNLLFVCLFSVNISESLKSGDTRIVIVIDYYTAKSNRGDRVKQLVGEVRKMFPSYPDLEASCMIAITKLPAEQKSRQQAFDTTVQVIQAAWLRDRSSSPPPSLASQHPAPDTQQSSGPPAFVPIHPLDDARFVLDKILALRPMTNASDHFVPILRDGASISLQAVLKDVTSNIETFLKEDCLKHAHDIFFLLSLLDKFASVKLQDAVAAKRDALLVIFDFVTIEQARQIEELSQSDETLKEKQRYREKFSKFEVTCKTFDTMSEGRLLEFFSKLGSTIEKRDHQQQSKEVESVKLRCERLLLELSQQLRSELNDVDIMSIVMSSCKQHFDNKCRDPSQSLISFLRSFAQQPKLHALHPVANVLCEEVELFCGRPRRCEAIYAYPSAAEASKAYDAFSLNACEQFLTTCFDFLRIEHARQIEELSQSDETLKEKQRYREKFSSFEVTCKTFDTMSSGRLLEFFSKLGSTIEKRDHQQQSKEVESVKLRCERLLLELSQQLRSELNDVELKKMLASSCKRYCGDCRDPSQSLISFLRSFAQQPKLHALHPVANVLCEEVELFCGRPRRCEAIYAYPSAAEASKAYDAFSLNACKQLSLVGLQLREAELELIAVKVLNKMDDVLEKSGDPQLCCKIGHDVLSNASKCDLDASEIDVLREFDDFSASHLFQPATSIQSQITKGSVVHVVRPKKKPFHLRLHPDPSTDVVNRVTPAVLYSHSDDFVVLETPKPSTEFIRVKAKNGSCGFVRLCYLVSVHASSVVEECSADERDIEGDIDEQTECSGIPFVSLIGSSDPSVVFTDFKIRLEVESCKKCLRWIMKQKDQFFRHNQHGSVSMWLKSLHAQKHHRDAEFSAIQSELRQAIPTLYDERTVNGWITGHEFTTLSFFFSEAIKLQACVEWCLPDLQVDRFQTQVSKAIEELNVAAGQDVDRYIGSPEFCGKHGITSLISLLDLNREIQQTPLRDRFRRLLENFGIKLQEQIKLLCQCRTHGPNLCNIVLKMMCLNDFLVDVGIPDDFVVDQVQNLLTISPEEIVALAGREMIACAQDESKSVANKAIQMFPQFRSVYVKQYNKRASVNTIDKVLDAMKVHASDRASGSSINASAKGLLHQCHRKVDDVFTEHMKSAIKAGKSQASISLSGRQPSTRSKSVESEVLDVIRTEVGRILQKIIPSWFPVSKPELNFARCHMDVSALLGNLFAAYSIKGGCSLQDDDRETWLQPHATQIVCILMLLGIGSDDGSQAKNHLAEVGTGEGKSVILGILGLLFALIGRKVDIVCYSPYLLERDEKQFKDLFDFFSTFPNFVRPRYTTILNLQERFAEDGILPDLPKCVQQAAMNSPYSFKGKDDKRNRVLLIDEVDVFFGENFYGEVSASAHIFDDDAAKDLVKHVFDSRATHNSSTIAASIPVLMAHPSAIKFQTLHPRLDLEQHLKQMLRDLTLSDFPTGVACLGKGQSHVKVMKEVDDIGYTNMATGAVERKVTYRYKTFFAYLFRCRVIKDIDETKNSRRFGILLNCGYQLYSDLPKHCGLLLGVSGTVSQLSPGDLEVLREFQFSSTSLIPSTFKKEQLLQAASNEGFDVSFGSMDKFFADVISKIQRCRSKSSFHRPILVVFKDESAVKHFNDQFRATLPQWQPLPNLLREVDIFNERTRIIARATQEGSVTFVSRSYGRGTDFVSFCEAVNRNGGVHVILTFLPELKSEMVQIKGRTCRQDNKGSFEEIYWKDDLVKCDDGNVRYVSEEDLDIFWKGEGDWEKRRVFLEDRRKEFDRNRTDRMKARLEANRGRTESTTRMVDLAQNPRKLKDAIQIAYSFTFPSVTSSMHTIFILDESGSMTKNWSGLQQAFCRYLDTLQSDEESSADLISVIEFDDDARIVAQAISIDDARQLSLSIRGGGTKFAPAISKANDLLKEDASSKTDIVLVFMTDGANTDDDTSVEILRDIFHKFDTRNPKFRAIFFGVVQNQPPILTMMVHAVGSDGVLYNANDTMQLERTFVDIAEAMRVSDKSVDRKGSRLQRP